MKYVGIVTDDAVVRYYFDFEKYKKVAFVTTKKVREYQKCRYYDDEDVYNMANQIMMNH